MKRMIYGIGFFLALLFLGAGFFLSYQVADLRQEMTGSRKAAPRKGSRYPPWSLQKIRSWFLKLMRKAVFSGTVTGSLPMDRNRSFCVRKRKKKQALTRNFC